MSDLSGNLVATPFYSRPGDFVSISWDRAAIHVANRVNEWLTLYKAGDRIVGCKITGISALMPDGEDTENAFLAMQSAIRTPVEDMLRIHFGPRCEVYQEGCLCCERWRALDALFVNPYEDCDGHENAGEHA